MKKVYIAPNVKFAVNGSLEGVFASVDECGNTRTFSMKNSGLITMSSYCHTANHWLVGQNDSDLDD
ncbi:MAG: hypothetical protein PUC65_14465 [Clostridiales bacterium]|nr:hypothetical protein [Clostridiales bacterium]